MNAADQVWYAKQITKCQFDQDWAGAERLWVVVRDVYGMAGVQAVAVLVNAYND